MPYWVALERKNIDVCALHESRYIILVRQTGTESETDKEWEKKKDPYRQRERDKKIWMYILYKK